MFLIPAWASLWQRRIRLGSAERQKTGDFVWILTWLALTLLIGYRVEVGGDWASYIRLHEVIAEEPLIFAIKNSDPAYGALNWFSSRLGLGIYGVNLACGALFTWGLIAFCRQQPRPWLALLTAIPYLVVVVAMGYSRQGVAVGLAMLGLVALHRKSNWRFVIWVVIAALFHKSAVILIPLAILAAQRGRWWTAIWVGASTVVAYVLLLEQETNVILETYLETKYSSEGGAIRIMMNALPAFIFLFLRRHLKLEQQANSLWTWMSSIALIFVVLLLVSPSSTAVDRVALYFIPLQLFVFSRLPNVWRASGTGVALAVIAYYGLVQFVWLNFADNAEAWLPYRFYPLEILNDSAPL